MKDAGKQKSDYFFGVSWAEACAKLGYTVDQALAPLAGQPPELLSGFIDGLADVEGALDVNPEYVNNYMRAHREAYERYTDAYVATFGKKPGRARNELTLKDIHFEMECLGGKEPQKTPKSTEAGEAAALHIKQAEETK